MRSIPVIYFTGAQGKAAQEEAARLAAAVAEEQRNVRAALQALETERARLTAVAEAEKARLQKQVRRKLDPEICSYVPGWCMVITYC